MLRSVGKQSGKSVESVLKKKRRLWFTKGPVPETSTTAINTSNTIRTQTGAA